MPTAKSSISYKDDDYSFWFFAKVIAKLMIVSTTNLDDNISGNKKKKLFIIQYTKEEVDKIQNDFLE